MCTFDVAMSTFDVAMCSDQLPGRPNLNWTGLDWAATMRIERYLEIIHEAQKVLDPTHSPIIT